MASEQSSLVVCALPRVTIQFCTQCKWMLRAAYFAQELLSTFSLSLGEVALQPSTGGTFIVTIHTSSPDTPSAVSSKILWDRKTDGGFPETKELKRRVRDVIEPGRDLGHVDRHSKTTTTTDQPRGKEKEERETEEGGVAESSTESPAATTAAADAKQGVDNDAEQPKHLPAVTARHPPSSTTIALTTSPAGTSNKCEDCI